MIAPSLQNRAALYVAKMPPAISGQGGHNQTFAVATALLHGFALGEGHAWPILADYNGRCLPPWSESELRHKLRSAAAAAPRRAHGWLVAGEVSHAAHVPPPPPPPARLADIKPDIEKLNALSSKAGGFGESELIARSPIDPTTVSPAQFLEALYYKGEKVLLFNDMKSKHPFYTFRVGEANAPQALKQLQTGQALGAWFLVNPVSGQWLDDSCRSVRTATAFRWAVLESDELPPDMWLKIVCQLPLPICAMYTSGGRSIHALWRVAAPTKFNWDFQVLPYKKTLAAMGADPGALTAVRLSRLPGCERAEKQGVQRLLFLAPGNPGVPICQWPAAARHNLPF